MKIIYMGTPEFAVAPLEMLAKTEHNIGYVFTQPDKAKDRGKKIQFTPVKEKACQLNIPVVQPEKIKGNQEMEKLIKEYAPDLIIVVAYGQILPKNILDIPRLGCINIHGSILPLYRGAAPIQHAIIKGEEKTGITLMQMDEGMDTGDILAVADTYINGKNFKSLYDELSKLGGELLIEKLDDIENKRITPIKQKDEEASTAPMIFKSDCQINFHKDAISIERLIRGLNPSPGAYTIYNGEPMKIFVANVVESKEIESIEPGTIVNVFKDGFEVTTGKDKLLIKEIQMPNKRKMSVEDFLKGNKILLNTKLTS